MYALLRPLLFCLDAELAHDLSLNALGRLADLHLLHGAPVQRSRRVMGIDFPNPVGLAAGLDKNGDYIAALGALGFGFIEVGTVTPRPQPGNPKPRMFRLTPAEALINRMGFNNKGVDHLVKQVRGSRYQGVLGINIGKNKDTPLEQANEDYLACLEKVYPHADYVVVNISSPNTPGLRELQRGEALDALLAPLKESQGRLESRHGRYVPLVVKIAPDMEGEEVALVADRLIANGIDGVTATNTTTTRDGVEGLAHADEQGGLSGAPLRARADQVLEQLAQALNGRMPVIGVGGITAGDHAAEKERLGASLVQLYTGFIYRGPALVPECVSAMARADA
ncbi:quinone-dependent dihydroorotate dehydrogenase [Ectothiorhodospiraceae bacterium WFHF3C12]|nr:quinone-dependent dihydroorotate dehydrogenase [Ectothiorhodospiraceae bacterium WFHF3C12]